MRRYQLESERSDLQLQGQLSAKSQNPLNGEAAQRFHDATFSASYEIDLWGRLARTHDVSAWLASASQAERRALMLVLDADVAQAYWQRSALSSRLVLAEQRHEIQQRLLALTQVAVNAGAEPPRELWNRKQALLLSEQTLSQLAREEQLIALRLATLLDRTTPPPTTVVRWGLDAPLPAVGANLPADLLARRPDVMAQEARLRSRLAALDVSQANFMPALTLTGSLGATSSALGQLFSLPSGAALASLALPFLNWKNLSIAREQARIDYLSVSLDYRRSVMQALRETRDALSWHQRLQQDQLRAQEALALAQKNEQEATLRVEQGDQSAITQYHAVLLRNEYEDVLIRVQLDQRSNLAMLYKALGGAPKS
jgi:outer membrane protein TolC